MYKHIFKSFQKLISISKCFVYFFKEVLYLRLAKLFVIGEAAKHFLGFSFLLLCLPKQHLDGLVLSQSGNNSAGNYNSP